MKKNILYSLILIGLSACNAGGNGSSSTCPVTAPQFSADIGTALINAWGTNVYYYSPYGSGGYTDPYLGAAYFTAAQYFSDAVLLPTVSPTTRVGSQAIYNYFTSFLAHGPQMTNNPGTPQSGGPYITQAGCGYGVISGYYNFTFADGTAPANARYTFQFQYSTAINNIAITVESGTESGKTLNILQTPGKWYIMLQNSATLPSSFGLPQNLLVK